MNKEQQRQYLIDIMKADEELGLYNENLDKKSYLLGYTDATKKIDEFAIGFAEWLLNERTGFNRETEIKELLEIYKKEKGL
jgi:hypothetical protein